MITPLPEDKGWKTLAETFLRLQNAELRRWELELQEKARRTELERQFGRKEWLEDTYGGKIKLFNPTHEEGYEKRPGTDLSKQFAEINPALTTLENVIKAYPYKEKERPSAEFFTEMANAPTMKGLKERGQREVAAQEEWEASPEKREKEITYQFADEAAQQILSNFGKGMKEAQQKGDIWKMRDIYNKSAAALMGLGVIYKRKDAPQLLGPLKWYLGGMGGGAKMREYKFPLGPEYGQVEIPFQSAYRIGTEGFYRDFEKAAKIQTGESIPRTAIKRAATLGTGVTPEASPERMQGYKLNIQQEVDAINEDKEMSPKEKLKEFNRLAKKMRVVLQIDADTSIFPWGTNTVKATIIESGVPGRLKVGKGVPEMMDNPWEKGTYDKEMDDLEKEFLRKKK